jgi:hypothetical protein
MEAHHISKEAPISIMISSATHPKSLDDLNQFHKDPMYELISGTREAYLIKKLAGDLSTNVSKSENVQSLARLISDTSNELERSWRMGSCMSNAPVSTTYPYLPTMPVGPVSTVPQKLASLSFPDLFPSLINSDRPIAPHRTTLREFI